MKNGKIEKKDYEKQMYFFTIAYTLQGTDISSEFVAIAPDLKEAKKALLFHISNAINLIQKSKYNF